VRYVAAASLLLALVGCGREEPHLVPPKTTVTQALATIPDAPTSTTLIPSDASSPAAGTCANAPATGATQIVLNPDVPSPRCVIVHAANQLDFTNNTDAAQSVSTGYDSVTIQPHESHLFTQRVGDEWEPGVHRIDTGPLYAGSGPEVWLQS
jgi:hypothetical protein